MSSPPAAVPADIQVISVVPILRMYDVAATIRFYVDYLGCSLDWQNGEGDRPVYLQVSRGGLQLHLSSHHDDGTPGTAVLVEVRNIDALHTELHTRGYPFFNPGIGQVLAMSGRCSSSTLLPTGSASTSPHQPGKTLAPALLRRPPTSSREYPGPEGLIWFEPWGDRLLNLDHGHADLARLARLSLRRGSHCTDRCTRRRYTRRDRQRAS